MSTERHRHVERQAWSQVRRQPSAVSCSLKRDEGLLTPKEDEEERRPARLLQQGPAERRVVGSEAQEREGEGRGAREDDEHAERDGPRRDEGLQSDGERKSSSQRARTRARERARGTHAVEGRDEEPIERVVDQS